MTQFDDDFLEVTKPFKKHRPSTTPTKNISYVGSQHRRRSARKSLDLRCQSKCQFWKIPKTNEEIVKKIPNLFIE